MDTKKISITNIHRLETQTRAALDDSKVSEYAEDMSGGEGFPPPVVFFDGKTYWLGDGFHRVAAHERNGRTRVECEVREGGILDAVVFGACANAKHGLRRTNADKRHSVKLLLSILEKRGEDWSDRKVAEACAIHHDTVASVRSQLAESATSKPNPAKPRRTGKDGKQYKPRSVRLAEEAGGDPESANAYIGVSHAMAGAHTRTEADAAYSLLSKAAADGLVSATEIDELTDQYRTTLTRIDAQDEEPDVAPEVFDGDDPAPRVPDRPDIWGSFDVSQRVFRIANACKESAERILSLYDDIDPRFAAEVRRSAQDSVLRLVMALDALLPPDGARAEINRAKFGVVTGGKAT